MLLGPYEMSVSDSDSASNSGEHSRPQRVDLLDTESEQGSEVCLGGMELEALGVGAGSETCLRGIVAMRFSSQGGSVTDLGGIDDGMVLRENSSVG